MKEGPSNGHDWRLLCSLASEPAKAEDLCEGSEVASWIVLTACIVVVADAEHHFLDSSTSVLQFFLKQLRDNLRRIAVGTAPEG